MQKVIEEIESKKRRDMPLDPERRFIRTDVDAVEAASETYP
jgi:hypothetical protein